MPDDLIISGGGSSAVATDELYASAQLLVRLGREVAAMRAQLASIDNTLSMSRLQEWAAPASAARAERDLDQLAVVLVQVETEARMLEWALSTVADGYGFAERFVGSLIGNAASGIGGLLGRLVPGALLGSAGGVAALGAAGGLALAGRHAGVTAPRGVPEASAGARAANGVVSNAATVALVRVATEGVGGAALGVAGVPQPLVGAVAPGKFPFAAGAIMGAGSTVGLLDETPVRLAARHPLATDGPPSGYAERLARVPDTAGAQVVVERYAMERGPDRFAVYVAGTADFSPVPGTEPWDMTSNLANAAGFGGGSYASVVEAMRLAGVQEDNPVQFTGYSQGGGTVARLAASGEFATHGVLSFGGPTGQVPIPEGFPTVLVEHSDDLVPALGGMQGNHQAVVVERDVFGGRDIPDRYAVPAHHLEYYEQTARLMDQAHSDQVRGSIAELDGFTDGATLASSTAYRFERVSETSSR